MENRDMVIGEWYKRGIEDTEKALISGALNRSFGNQSLAAKILGINRNTLRAKISKLNIDSRCFKI
jgi:DNA-binding protein Fis